MQRLDKILQDAGIKLSSVASSLQGVSSRTILAALVAGEVDPEKLGKLAKGRMRRKLPELEAALQGRFSRHHALLVGEILAKLDYLDELIDRLSDEVERAITPFAQQVQLLDTIPGVDLRMAEALVAEIGVDMSRFGSWPGWHPGQDSAQVSTNRPASHKEAGPAKDRSGYMPISPRLSRPPPTPRGPTCRPSTLACEVGADHQ